MPALIVACCLLLAVSLPAHADLFRWVDAETGTVKFSNLPPPAAAKGVQVIRYGTPAPAAAAEPKAVVPPRPAPAANAAAPAPAPDAQNTISVLQERWNELREKFAVIPPSTDFERAGSGIQGQVEAYKAVSAELDRMDPAGAARRRSEEGGALDRFMKGLGAHLSSGAPQAPAAAARK